MLNKEACEKAIDNVARYCSDYKLCMIPPRFELTNELEVLMDLIKEHFDTPPYRFDELKINMWVWDEKEKKCNKIIEIEGRNIDFYYITESIDRFIVEFEENRFYHVTKALEYQK